MHWYLGGWAIPRIIRLFTSIYFLRMLQCRPLLLKVWSSDRSAGDTWGLVRNTGSQAPPHPARPILFRNLQFNESPGYLNVLKVEKSWYKEVESRSVMSQPNKRFRLSEASLRSPGRGRNAHTNCRAPHLLRGSPPWPRIRITREFVTLAGAQGPPWPHGWKSAFSKALRLIPSCSQTWELETGIHRPVTREISLPTARHKQPLLLLSSSSFS